MHIWLVCVYACGGVDVEVVPAKVVDLVDFDVDASFSDAAIAAEAFPTVEFVEPRAAGVARPSDRPSAEVYQQADPRTPPPVTRGRGTDARVDADSRPDRPGTAARRRALR
jgi:hypothetical protein